MDMSLKWNDFLSKTLSKAPPAMVLLLSFLLAILVGACLLSLPISTVSGGIPFIDALFTATSAVCVTGLIVVDTGSYFTLFGQWVILALIQIGGLGVMTVTVMVFRAIGRSISFRQRLIMQDVFAHTPRRDILHLVKEILLFTAAVESAGAALLFIHWVREYPLAAALYAAIFHSISAFCNAGFSTFSTSMMNYSGDPLLNLTVCALIVIGGIGFPVLYDLYHSGILTRGSRIRLSTQTKTVLVTTAVLIAGGALLFGFLETRGVLREMPFRERMLVSLFQSVTCRTAGFNTVDIGALGSATLAMMILLMFFGASPGSCGGGVKTTTLALIAAFAWSRIKRNQRVNMFKKSIPPETVARSTSLILISLGFVSVIFFLVLAGSPAAGKNSHDSFLLYLFETVSAFGTVGLSMGATATLTGMGKLWIIVMMLIGRVGVLTFSYIIAGTEPIRGIEYAKENIMIG